METQKQEQEERLESGNKWQGLKEKLEKLVGKNVLVIYDIGHGLVIVGSVLKKVKADGLKLAGHFWLGFIQTDRISCGKRVVFERRNEREQKQKIRIHWGS